MIDPTHFTNYDLTVPQLEEHILFSIAVAGKTALVMAPCLDKLLQETHREYSIRGWQPFKAIRQFDQPALAEKMQNCGIGCMTLKSKGFLAVAHSGLDLRTCTLFDLVELYGISYKTANFFLLHTRRGHKAAVLDTHILKYLRSLGYNVPSAAPQSKKRYDQVEQIFIKVAKEQGKDLAELDLALWNQYSRKVKRKANV